MTHFLAEEVSASERLGLQEHLDACEDCSVRLEVEVGFGRALSRRLTPAPAPPGLETRIRARLAEETPRTSTSWFRTPWFATASAAVLLAVLILAGSGRPGSPPPVGPVPIFSQSVTVVDRECERMGKTLQQQRHCRDRHHLNMLRVGDGDYWFLGLDHEAARQLLLEPEMRGRQLLVDGKFYPEIHTLRLTGYRELDGPPAAALPASL